MSLVVAVATLAEIEVSGVTKSYTIGELKKGINKPDLPALVPLITTGEFNRAVYGNAETAYDGTHRIVHRLLYSPAETITLGQAQDGIAAIIDNYKKALETLSSHTGAINIRPTTYEAGVVSWQGVLYNGCDFITELWVC